MKIYFHKSNCLIYLASQNKIDVSYILDQKVKHITIKIPFIKKNSSIKIKYVTGQNSSQK